MKYRNIVFDLYGTLIDIRTDEEDPAFWDKTAAFYTSKGALYNGRELRETYLSLVRKEKEYTADPLYPEVDLQRVFSALYCKRNTYAGEELLNETAGFFRIASLIRLGLYPGVRELLDFLHGQGCRLFLLSNAQRCFTMRELEICGIKEDFEKIYLSSDHLCCKPSPGFFEILFRENGIRREETLMIGNDWLADMQGAYDAGFSGIYIHQTISPPVTGRLRALFAVNDGDVFRILEYLRKNG
jgi:putative hydrolase of the HAD superfamily